VQGRIEKRHELHFRHRSQVGNGHAKRHAHNAGLRQWGIHDTLRAVQRLQTFGDAKHPTSAPDVFAESITRSSAAISQRRASLMASTSVRSAMALSLAV